MPPAVPPETPNTPAPAPDRATSRRHLARGLTLVALGALLIFVGLQGAALLHEYLSLQDALSDVRASAVVGYPGITPQYSFARMPPDWFHEEGDSTLLWGGWRHEAGHIWFRVRRGEVDRLHISNPMGKDTIRAIRCPIVETGGGRVWTRIPDEAPVVGVRLAGVDTAYPVLVLEKVLVVNDTVGRRPSLVLAFPFARKPQERTVVYDPVVDGERLTMGHSGYFQDGKPMLYDRETESLWVGDVGSLRAIAGPSKGLSLPPVARPLPVSWSDWRDEHPDGRLVVGADRSAEDPAL